MLSYLQKHFLSQECLYLQYQNEQINNITQMYFKIIVLETPLKIYHDKK